MLKLKNLFLTLFLFPTLLLAWPPMFGPEWEFTNAAVERESYSPDKASHDLFLAIAKKCKQTKSCRADEFNQRITFNNGYWMNISADPGTIEVQATPSTIEEFKKVKNLVQTYLFDVARAEGFLPNSKKWGAGQIHIDRATSGMAKNPQLFRNFLVDFYNHWEIGAGVLEFDNNNAKVVALLDAETKAKLRGVLLPGIHYSDSNVLENVIKKIHRDRYTALNLNNDQTLEVRSLRMQESAEDYLKMTKLFEARLNWLRKQTSNIPLQEWKVKSDDSLMARMFQAYVKESGLDWKDYSAMVPKEYRPEEKIIYNSLTPTDQTKETKKLTEEILKEFIVNKNFHGNSYLDVITHLDDKLRVPLIKEIAERVMADNVELSGPRRLYKQYVEGISQLLANSRVNDPIVIKALLKLIDKKSSDYYVRSQIAGKIELYLNNGGLLPDDENLKVLYILSQKTVNAKLTELVMPVVLKRKPSELFEFMEIAGEKEAIEMGRVIKNAPDFEQSVRKKLSESIKKLLKRCSDPENMYVKNDLVRLKHLSYKALPAERLRIEKIMVKSMDDVTTYSAAIDGLLEMRPLSKETKMILKKRFKKGDDGIYQELSKATSCREIFE